MKTVYNLKLHESEDFVVGSEVIKVLRVPGGWIYMIYNSHEPHTQVFVPFSNEYQFDYSNKKE